MSDLLVELLPGDKFKAKEKELRSVLTSGKFYVMRLDGKAFHSFTKGFARPYDEGFMGAMDKTAEFIMKQVVSGALFAYVQSDEISIVFTDRFTTTTQLPFGGKVEKLLSVAASAATGGFMSAMTTKTVPLFDARLTVLDSLEEVVEYVHWRRLDAQKNAITMATSVLYSHKELQGVSTRDRRGLLAGTPFEVLPDGFYNGRLIVSEKVEKSVTYVNKKTQKEHTVPAIRSVWVAKPALKEHTEELVMSFGL